jgi:hypothetical protein
MITTGTQERAGMIELAKKGKVELLRKDFAFYVFFDGTPVNYWHDREQAISEYNRICDLDL